MTIKNETEEQLKLDSMLNYFEQQLAKFQNDLNHITANQSIYQSKSFDDNNNSDNNTIISSLKSSSLNADNSFNLYWSHLKQSMDNCEHRINQLDHCLQCMVDIGKDDLLKIEQNLNNYNYRIGKTDLKFSHRFNELKSKYEINLNKMKKIKNQFTKEFDSWREFMTNLEKAEQWLTLNESLSKKVHYVTTADDNQPQETNNQQTILNQHKHDNVINSNISEQDIKFMNDKELLSKQLSNLEQLEINLKEHGMKLREQVEQSAYYLLFNLIPNSIEFLKNKQNKFNRKSNIIDCINCTMEHLLKRYNEYKVNLQMIHSNLNEKYLCWSKLNNNFEQANHWLNTIELQLNTMEIETNSLSTILMNDVSQQHKTNDYFAIHQLNAWSNSKLCILTNLIDEMQKYNETELVQLKEIVQAQNSIDQLFREYSKDHENATNSTNETISLEQNALKQLNNIFEKYNHLKNRLDSLIQLNHIILNLCEKFVHKRCEIFQWLINQRHELERLLNSTERYSIQTDLRSLSIDLLNDEVMKLCKMFHQTINDVEAFKKSITNKYEEDLADLIKLIEELSRMTPLRMEPAEMYIMDLKREVKEFFNQVTSKLEHFRVWNDKWSNFSLDCNSLIQWINEQEALIISTSIAQSSIELKDSSFQITNSNVVEKELSQLTDQVDRNRQLRIILIGNQPAMESLIVKAQSLIKLRMFSTGVYLYDDNECKGPDKSVNTSSSTGNLPVGNIAINIATHIMQRYQTLISICDRRAETSQTAQKMIEQLLNSCRNYDQWACEYRIKLSNVEFTLNSYDSHSVPLQKSNNYSSIRSSMIDLETKIESGESFVQLIKDWTDRYLTELLAQVNQRRSELETLNHSASIDNENSDHKNELLVFDGKLKSISNYAETDYQVLKEMVRSLRNRFDKITQNVNQRSLSREKLTTWITTTENQLDLINTHMNFSGLSKIILDAPMDDFDKLIEKVINYMLTASESITQLTVDSRKQNAEIKNSDCVDENLQNRFDKLNKNIQSTHYDISNCLKLFYQFQNEVQTFSNWITDCENKFLRLSDDDSNQLAMFLQSNSLTMIMNGDDDNDAEQILHQLDISCRNSICQLTEAKQKLLIIKEISSALENRGHQLNKQLIESGEQLTSQLKILEEFSVGGGGGGGAQIKSIGGDVGRSLSALESSDRLSVIIQNYIDQLQCRLIRLDKIQTVFTINLTELVDCWSDWKNSFDRLIDWLNGIATNLRRPIFHSLDSLSTKQQLANSLNAFYQDCVGKKADFDLCLLKANHVKNLASNCNLPDQSEKLFEQYKNTLDTAYAALQQMQNSVEIHEQFDQNVSRTTQWLESLASKLNSLSTNENTDRVALEQNLLICQNLSETITLQSETYITQLVELADQVCRTTDSLINKEILDKIDVFRQLIRQNIQQLTNIQLNIESKLNTINNWENLKSVIENNLNSTSQMILNIFLEAKTSIEQIPLITSTVLLSIKEESLKKFENVKQELEQIQLKIDEFKKCTEKYMEFEHKLNIMQQFDQLTEKYTKIRSEIEIHLVKINQELKILRIFHSKIDESKNWLLQISLKLIAIHATNPDGPQGVIHLGQTENELRKQLITYREQNLKELKLFITNCPSEKDLIIEIDHVIKTLFQTTSGVSIQVAEQIMEKMNQINDSSQFGKDDSKDECKIDHTKTWAELFSLEVVQLESTCENLEVMCKRIKDRLMEQQQRWAKFVSVLIRVDKFLRIELSKWWLINSKKFINHTDTTTALINNVDTDTTHHHHNECDLDDIVLTDDDQSLQSETSKEVELVFCEENLLLGKTHHHQQQQQTNKQSTTLPSIQELLAQITNAKAIHAKIQIYLQELSAVKHRCSTPPPQPIVTTNLVSSTQFYNPSAILTELLDSSNNKIIENINFTSSVNGLPTTATATATVTITTTATATTTTTLYESSNIKAQITEEKMHALSGLELRRRATYLNDQLEIELKRLDKYIETLHDLKIRLDQQYLCEIEFLNWLHKKQIEFNQIINLQQQNQSHHHHHHQDHHNNNYYTQLYKAMDTVHLENLLKELHSKKSIIEQLKIQSKTLLIHHKNTDDDHAKIYYSQNIQLIEHDYKILIKNIQDHLNNRRLLTNQALEATKLTDKLHTDLHEVVKRSMGIDNVQCSIDEELKKIGNYIDQVSHVQKELQNTEKEVNQCLLYVDLRTQGDFQMYMELKHKELDNIYDALHTELDHFTIHSIYSNLYIKQLNNILERLCRIRKEIIKPVTIDLINENSNNIISLINIHDLNISKIYQLREEALHLMMTFASLNFKLKDLKTSNYYFNLIIQIKWKFYELNHLEFHCENIQSFNNSLWLFNSILTDNTLNQQSDSYDLTKSLAFRRREFLVQYNAQCKLFFEKLKFIKMQLETIKQMFTCCIKQNILHHSDCLIDSNLNQSPFMNVNRSLNDMLYFLKSYLEQLKKIELSIRNIEYNSIFSISMTLQHILTNESKQLVNNELCNIYKIIISNVIYCERQINWIVYLLNRVEHLLREYNQCYKSIIDKLLKDFYSVKQIQDYIRKLDTFHCWLNQVESEFQTIKGDGDTAYSSINIYCIKEIQISMKPLCESVVIHLKQVKAVIVSHLINLHNRLTGLNQLQIHSIQCCHYASPIDHARIQSLCPYTISKHFPAKKSIRKRTNSSSSSSPKTTEINRDSLISLVYFYEKNNLSSFFKNEKRIKSNHRLLNDVILTSIQSSSSSTSSTLCYSQNEENHLNFKEINKQIIKETSTEVVNSTNRTVDKILTDPIPLCSDEDFNLTHDYHYVAKDWTTKKKRLIENFSSFIQKYETCSKNISLLQTENKLEDESTTKFHCQDYYFDSIKEMSHNIYSHTSILSYLPMFNDIRASSSFSCRTEKSASFKLNGCSLHTLLSKSFNNLLDITKKFQLDLISFNETDLTALNTTNWNDGMNFYQNIHDNDQWSAILNPFHSPLIKYLNSMLEKYSDDKNDVIIEQNELTFIECNLVNIWKYFNEIIFNVKMDYEKFDLIDDFIKMTDDNMVIIDFEHISSDLFDQFIMLTNEIHSSIINLNKYLSKLSSSEHKILPLPNLWSTLFKTKDLLCTEMIYSRILIFIFYAVYKSLLLIYDILSMYNFHRKSNTFKLYPRNTHTVLNKNYQTILLNEFNYLQCILKQIHPFHVNNAINQQCDELTLQYTTVYLLDKYNSSEYSLNLSNILISLIEYFNKPFNFLSTVITILENNIKLNYPLNNDHKKSENLIDNNNNNQYSCMKSTLTIIPCQTLQIFEYLLNITELIIKTPLLTIKELENRYNKNLALFTDIHFHCYQINFLNESIKNNNVITGDDQPIKCEEYEASVQQQQRITNLINQGLNLNYKLMIWSANSYSLLDRWKRLSVQVDWFNVHVQNLWNRLPETPVPNAPQFKLDYLLLENKRNQFICNLKFISPIQVSNNILISANSLDALLYYKSWIENIFKSFKSLMPICEAILCEGQSLTNELLHINTINIDENVVDMSENVQISSSFNNNNNKFWNKEFKLFWDLLIDWIFNLMIEFNRQTFYIQLLEDCVNDLTLWITSKKSKLHHTMKQFNIQLKQYPNDLYRNMKALSEIDLIISDLCINEKIVQLNNLNLYIDQFNKNDSHCQSYLFYFRLINSGRGIIKTYNECLSKCKQILDKYQQMILGTISQFSTKTDEYSITFTILHYFHDWFSLMIKRFYNNDLKFIKSNGISDNILYAIVENIHHRLEIHLPILLELFNLEQRQLWIDYKDCDDNVACSFYSEQIVQCKKYIETLRKVQITLSTELYEYQQLKLCFDQLFIEIEVFNIKYPDITKYTNVENNFFTKYIFTELSNIKKTDETLRKSLISRLISLKIRTEQFISTSKLTQITALKSIFNIHQISENQINESLFTNKTMNTILEKLNYINSQFQNKIEHNYSMENHQLLFSNYNCLKSVIIENLIKFYQTLHRLVHLNGRVKFLQQISEKLNLINNFDNSKFYMYHHRLTSSLMLNFKNEIQVLKEYWTYNNSSDVMIDTDQSFVKQSIFQQFINYGHRILNLVQCEMNCSICEYIQISTKSLLTEFTTIRLTVIQGLEQLSSNFHIHINHFEKLQPVFTSILHQLQQSEHVCETTIQELLTTDNHGTYSLQSSDNIDSHKMNSDNLDFNYIPPNLSLINLAKLACQHTLLSNLKEFSTKSMINESICSWNQQSSNLIKLTDLCLCHAKHQRIHWINKMAYLQSTQLYSTGLFSSNNIDDNNKLEFCITQKDDIINNLIRSIKHTITASLLNNNMNNLFNLSSLKSLWLNLKLEHLNNFMEYLTDHMNVNNQDSYYICVNSYLLQQFNILEQNIQYSINSLFITINKHQFKFKLDDIIQQFINVNVFLDQLFKIEELLQICYNEYKHVISYHVNDMNIQLLLDLSILLINCLQVYINQLTQQIQYESKEILAYIQTNIKRLIEQMKIMLLFDNADNGDAKTCIQQPDHQIIHRCTSLNNPNPVCSMKSTSIEQIQFKLLYMSCIHNQLVKLCEINWNNMKNAKDKTILLRQFCYSYTCLNRIDQYIEYYNNTH
ncbi:unnamed protein product [Schistosoma turkestanicum]|nr:unnamed protein product [Schistosoma turkestanicum]